MSQQLTLAGLGEVLWDIFPDGAKFGGAPANYSCISAGLVKGQARVFIASAVGDDELGRKAATTLRGHQVDTSCLQVSPHPTGTVTIEMDPQRYASYTFASNTAWDNLQWSDNWKKLASDADAVCFGTLGQRSESSSTVIKQFLSATRNDAWRIFDINIRRPFLTNDAVVQSLEAANVVKLNEEELPFVAELCQITGTITEQLAQMVRRYDLECIALTQGKDGSILLRGNEFSESPAVKTEVVDTVGAGDAFTAVLSIGLLNDWPLQVINDRASRVAAFVCSQAGATPSIPEALRENWFRE